MREKNKLNTLQQAIAALKRGEFIILVDDEKRENEGDLILAAEFATAEKINFMCHYGRGLICLPLTEEAFERLGIPMMVKHNHSRHQTAFGVSIGAATGISTGISTADRARTIRVACNPNSNHKDIVMPGHVFPLCAKPGGVLQRSGHTEGSVDLMRIAELQPAAVLCEIMNPDGSMARLLDLICFAKRHNLPIIRVEDIVAHRIQHEKLITPVSSAYLPVRNRGKFRIHTYRNCFTGVECIALVREPLDADVPCLVRLHSECLTGDVFASARCDCGVQLEMALEQIAVQGGVLLYLRQEGRGIGLGNKIKAYELQDQGLDTVQANHQLGFPADQRDYGIAVQMLQSLHIKQIRLLTNNPHKISNLQRYGIKVIDRIPLESPPTLDNIHYLRTKRDKLGHLLENIL